MSRNSFPAVHPDNHINSSIHQHTGRAARSHFIRRHILIQRQDGERSRHGFAGEEEDGDIKPSHLCAIMRKGIGGETLQKWWNGSDVVFSLAPCFLCVSLKMHLLRSLLPPLTQENAKQQSTEHLTGGCVTTPFYFQEKKKKTGEEKWEQEERCGFSQAAVGSDEEKELIFLLLRHPLVGKWTDEVEEGARERQRWFVFIKGTQFEMKPKTNIRKC